MHKRGPLFTLLAVIVFGLVLIGVNMSKQQAEPAGAGVLTTPTTPTTPTTTTVSTATTVSTTTATSPYSDQGAYVGRAQNASIAIAVKGEQAVAYVCDGQRTELWLQGTVNGATLSMAGNGATLTASITGDVVSGSITVGASQQSFTASAAGPPAGLYRANPGGGDKIGWIVLPDGSQVGIRSRDGVAQQPAPRLDPTVGSVTVDGNQAPVTRVEGDAGVG